MALGVAVLHQLLQFSAQLPGLARDIGTDHIPGLLTSLLGLKAEVRGDPWRRGGAEQGCVGAQRPLAARRGRAGMCGGTATPGCSAGQSRDVWGHSDTRGGGVPGGGYNHKNKGVN